VEVQAKEIFALREIMTNLYVKHTGHSHEKLTKDMERDFFMTPQQALEYGLIDEVVEIMPKGVADAMRGGDEL
jgi:ATP-dependent Clp protease, protease subunit